MADFLVQEDGFLFILEDDGGAILLEVQPPPTDGEEVLDRSFIGVP